MHYGVVFAVSIRTIVCSGVYRSSQQLQQCVVMGGSHFFYLRYVDNGKCSEVIGSSLRTLKKKESART